MKWTAGSALWTAVVGLLVVGSFAQMPEKVTTDHPLNPATISPSPVPTSPTSPTSAKTSTITPTSTTTHTSSSSSSSTGSSTLIVTPVATLTPAPREGLVYNVNDSKDPRHPCIMFSAHEINITVTYNASGGKESKSFILNALSSGVDHNRSYCVERETNANLTISWSNSSDVEQLLVFQFTRQSYNWKLSAIRLILNVTHYDFPDITNTSVYEFLYEKAVFVNEYERSYECNSDQSFKLANTNKNTTEINETMVKLEATWQMQAFEFRDSKFEFGNARKCPQSVEKNVKLPAIVGGVLFLLLTAVVVVYIISRCRRRRLTSYEALK